VPVALCGRRPIGSAIPSVKMSEVLIPPFLDPPNKEAIRFEAGSLTYEQLLSAVSGMADRVHGAERVAVWASPTIDACIGILGVLAAGAAAVPINPRLGAMELEHIVDDCAPPLIVAARETELPPALRRCERVAIDLAARGSKLPPEAGPEAPALILYTSGTTGLPKGVVLSRRAVTSNLDALAEVWEWTADDVLVQGLPLFHVHGLVLGVLGPLRLGGRLHHVGRFSPEKLLREFEEEGTMLFAVPTMYFRLANAAERDPSLARALGRARLLVSGSAHLPVRDHARIERATSQRIVERYGLTETIMNCAVRASGDRRAGYVGPSLPGVEVRLVGDDGATIQVSDDEMIGEVAVRGPNLFTGYLNQADATASAMRDGWFFTGDLATRAPDGYLRIMGRRATDLIKTGGFKVGAGEVEAALLQHEAVAEAAVVGEPDTDLGERIVAFVVLREGTIASPATLSKHVATLLTPHKRPREVCFVQELPRNEMGKVKKSLLKRDARSRQ
jgi:malonyl-CoA/methylmalonyl-CoA synthetase